jgi:putative ABC transport system permease protein
MGLSESIRTALESLRANKMRSILTMLGIIIGIGSVIGILTVGRSMTGAVTSSMSDLGASNIYLSIQKRSDIYSSSNNMESQMMISTPEEKDLISEEMIETLRARYSNQIVGIGLAETAGSGQAKDGRRYANLSVIGVNDEYLDVNNTDLLAGRGISAEDVAGERSVAVVSDKLVNNLFGGDINAALGAELPVSIGSEIITIRIVGIYEYQESSFSFSMASEEDISTSLYVPLSVAQRLTGNDGFQSVTVLGNSDYDGARLAQDFGTFLERYYENNDDYGVTAISMDSIIEQMNSVMSTLSIAVSVIAGISLLVGGIGVMNIMLVSVTERTREIGTRKALGATNNQIRLQFVVESMIVCLIGGVIGMIFGSILGYIGSNLLDSPALPSVGSVVLAVSFSMAIGVFFGYYPANKAAHLDPIEALRYE